MKTRLLGLLIIGLMVSACKVKVKGNMEVFQREDGARMSVKTEDYGTVTLPASRFKAKLIVNTKKGKKSYLEFKFYRGNKKRTAEVPLNLPKVDDLLISTDPVKVEADKLGQSFGMMFMRTLKPGKDVYTVTFHDPSFEKIVGKMIFKYEPKKQLYDPNTKTFLASYQKVSRKHRAVVMKISSQFDDMIDAEGKWHGTALKHIVDYGGAILIAPWLWVRYKSIKWLIGSTSEEKTRKKWADVIAKYPVIDYFSFVHSGDEDQHYLDKSALRSNQLRVVYTGACFSDGAEGFVEDFGAVAGAGHAGVNAGPIWDLPAVRKWTYGYNFEKAMIKANNQGKRRAHTVEWLLLAPLWSNEDKGFLDWDSVDEMIEDSEIVVSYTDEIPASHVGISLSAVRKKQIGADNKLHVLPITKLEAQRNGAVYVESNSAPQNPNN